MKKLFYSLSVTKSPTWLFTGYIFVFLIFIGTTEGYSQTNVQTATLEASLSKAIKQKDDKSAQQYSLQLAEINVKQKKYEKAITYFNQSLTYSKLRKDYRSQFAAYDGLGLVYLTLKNYSKAADSFEDCVLAAQIARSKSFESTGLIHQSIAEAGTTHYKKAIARLENALALAIEIKSENLQLVCYQKLADNYSRIGDKEKSAVNNNLYNQIIENRRKNTISNQKLDKLKQKVSRAELELLQAEAEKELTEFKLAEQAMKLKNAEDSLRTVEAINSERQMQIDLLNKEKELSQLKILEQNAQLENDRLWRNSIIGGALLASILITVVIVDYRKKLKANKKIHQQSENIKSSINYAKRIQEAMLPKKEPFQAYVSDSFVLFKPKDNVSGDFYWFKEIKNGVPEKDFAFAAVDCTGHGVPGAFMSMIGMNALNSITGKGIVNTDQILNSLHTEIRTALNQEETGNNDGMDVALCVFKKHQNVLEFSGAKNPLVYIQNNQLVQIKGDIHPIGGSKSKPEMAFKKHEILIDKPTTVYLFSDGYRDQFGGKENTKFMSKNFTRLLLEIHELTMEKQKELLDIAIEEWKGNRTQTDDILVIGVRLDANNSAPK